MNRRSLLGGLAVMAGLSANRSTAQQKARPVIGILGEGSPEDRAIAHNLAMFRRGLRQEGFVEGQNVDIVYRWARNRPERLPALADELVALPVDVLVNEGGTITALQAKKATSTIPIVFHASNAIVDGLVDTLARPSANLTGVSQFTTETLTKAYQLLSEVAPAARGFALVSTGQAPSVTDRVLQDIRATTSLPVLGITVGRQREGRLRQVGPGRDVLHFLVGQCIRPEHHRHRVALEGHAGEHIDLLELQDHPVLARRTE